LIILTVPYLRDFFALDIPQWTIIIQTVAISVAGIILMEVAWRLSGWRTSENRMTGLMDSGRAA
jgi:hypothetical protein